MKTVQVERAQLEQWLQAFKKIHDDKHSHWDVDEEISAIEKALEPIAMDVMKSDEADFWRWWKPYQLKDCWRLELVARDAWMAAKATKQQTEQHARNAITWTPDTGYVFSQPKEPEQEPVAYIKAAELEELKHCNGMSLWAENAAVHTDDSISKQLLPSGHVPVYTTPPQRKPMTEWQPIETAPFDTDLLVFSDAGFISKGYRSNQYKNTWTHWMPLPDAPIEAAHGIKGEA